MTNRSKQKGTGWETAIVKYLQDSHWPHAERRTLQGRYDRGDIAGVPAVMIEAKAAKRIQLGLWWDETLVEKANDGADIGALWIKRPGKASAGDGLVVLSGEDFVQLLVAAGY